MKNTKILITVSMFILVLSVMLVLHLNLVNYGSVEPLFNVIVGFIIVMSFIQVIVSYYLTKGKLVLIDDKQKFYENLLDGLFASHDIKLIVYDSASDNLVHLSNFFVDKFTIPTRRINPTTVFENISSNEDTFALIMSFFKSNRGFFTIDTIVDKEKYRIYISKVYDSTCYVISLFPIERIIKDKYDEESPELTSLNVLCHELRSPLNSIGLLTNSIKEDSLSKDMLLEKANMIEYSVTHLSLIINNVLKNAKNTSISIESKAFNLKESIEQTISMLGSNALTKNISVNSDLSLLTSDMLFGDELKIKQIITNLVSNSIKYTLDGGNISINCKSQFMTRRNVLVHFTISDTGVGMSKEFLDKLFVPFSQELIIKDESSSGLGMSITKNIIDKMEGIIKVDSEIGVGTTFNVYVLLKSDGVVEEIDTSDTCLEGVRVLLLDDELVGRTLMSQAIQGFGGSVYELSDPLEALRHLEHSKSRYDVILMDMMMPNMTGWECASRIRSSNYWCKDIPLIGITGNTEKEDIVNAYISGMNYYVSKPINIGLLVDGINKTLSRGE